MKIVRKKRDRIECRLYTTTGAAAQSLEERGGGTVSKYLRQTQTRYNREKNKSLYHHHVYYHRSSVYMLEKGDQCHQSSLCFQQSKTVDEYPEKVKIAVYSRSAAHIVNTSLYVARDLFFVLSHFFFS